MKLYHFSADHLDPLRVAAACAAAPYSLWFDSADRAHSLARYSFIAFHPFETIEGKNGRVTITNRDQQLSLDGDPFAILQDRIAAYDIDIKDDPNLPPFQGGAAGFFGYDLARGLERLPQDTPGNPGMPDMAVGLYDKVCAFDHAAGKAWFLTLAADDMTAQAHWRLFRTMTENAAIPAPVSFTPDWQGREQPDGYKAKVQRVIDYIYAGDIFQANLSQQFHAALPADFDAFAHYCTLRRVNPAPFAAWMNFGAVKIASASPERFLSLRNHHVETRPIKGTRPRRADPAADAGMSDELARSAKDRAENAMIVDLLRNDISRVCDDHSVDVPQLCAIESFASVHHLVSVITGTLRADRDAIDLLRACFPGGSITGAPKVRAMEIIEELEPVRRGPYCGALGYISFAGAMDTNIVIRTLVYDGQSVSFNVGGGIVADSDPAAEYQETLDKGRALFRSFEGGEEKRQAAGG
jgi:para-aminobenzoate synthetase component 1